MGVTGAFKGLKKVRNENMPFQEYIAENGNQRIAIDMYAVFFAQFMKWVIIPLILGCSKKAQRMLLR